MKSGLNFAAPAAVAAMLFAISGQAADNGEAIFKQKCAACHGANGSGQTGMGKMFKLRDLRSPEVQKMTDAQMEDFIAHGKGRMPAFSQSLGKAKIQAVVAHLRELAKTK